MMRSTIILAALTALANTAAATPPVDAQDKTPWTPTSAPAPRPTGRRCPVTNTVTQLVGRDHGCAYDPSTDSCIYDAILTLPCGCRHADVLRTTTTACATRDGQMACATGYMYTTTAACPGTPTATAT